MFASASSIFLGKSREKIKCKTPIFIADLIYSTVFSLLIFMKTSLEYVQVYFSRVSTLNLTLMIEWVEENEA